jgi:hypothetical protein
MVLNLCGFLGWVERAGFYEALALNTVIIPQNAGYMVFGTPEHGSRARTVSQV